MPLRRDPRFKLASAVKGLEGNRLAIADIPQQCGFTSVQYLHTVFRREFGCTPHEYQQSR